MAETGDRIIPGAEKTRTFRAFFTVVCGGLSSEESFDTKGTERRWDRREMAENWRKSGSGFVAGSFLGEQVRKKKLFATFNLTFPADPFRLSNYWKISKSAGKPAYNIQFPALLTVTSKSNSSR